MSEFFIADIPDNIYEANRKQADEWFESGVPYKCSTGICESKTAGYGRLDCYGYWEYPLAVVDGIVCTNKSFEEVSKSDISILTKDTVNG